MYVSASFLGSFVRHGVMSIALLVSALGWSATPVPPPFVDDELLVAFKPGTPAAAIAAAHQQAGARIQKTIAAIGVQVLTVPAGNVPGLLQAYRANPNVRYAEPN